MATFKNEGDLFAFNSPPGFEQSAFDGIMIAVFGGHDLPPRDLLYPVVALPALMMYIPSPKGYSQAL